MSPQSIAGLSALGRLAADRSSVLAIGNFDGVHLGHQLVIQQAAELALLKGFACYVLTFDPSPAAVLGRGSLKRLTSVARKIELLCAVDPVVSVVVEPFTEALSRYSAEEFVRDALVRNARPEFIVVGGNFRFGRGREGSLEFLESMGQRYGFETRAQALRGDDGGSFSSTRVRESIEQGALESARAILGRPHALSGSVVRGQNRGASLGFPTANLSPPEEVLPPSGVYACLVDELDTAGFALTRLALGVMNLGVRPTFSAGPFSVAQSLEVHLLDFAGDLYGRALRVHLIRKLRDERRFSEVSLLKAQIGRDVEAAREALEDYKSSASVRAPWY